MRYLSVCSGIEAATVAWHQHGFEPLAFSEIEKFPRRVLAHHYPEVPLHGDFTALREQEWIGDADMLVGGTPCQAFSVAGLRNSLDDDRGNLTLEFVRLADAIDDLRPTGRGTIIVWENVPGVLSVNDNAFGCFLGALVGNDDPVVPTGGKWTSAGMVVGPKRSAAWRVLDAQYFGVAQRRRRVFVVASSRDGFDPAEVLFEREGVRRNTPPSREQGQEVAATVAARFGVSGDVAPTLTKEGTGVVRTGFQEDGWYVKGNHHAVAHPISFGAQMSNPQIDIDMVQTLGAKNPMAVTYSIMPMNSGKDYKAREVDVAQLIMASGPSGGNQGGDYIMQPIPLDLRNSGRDPEKYDAVNRQGVGVGEPGDPAHTVTSAFVHGMAQGMAVRCLTPVECERLQGFPDSYTNIPNAADGPRYKALGNSMAVPVMAWIGKRIAREVAA